MRPPSRYEIIYAPVVKNHLKALGRRYYSLIRQVIEEQLSFEPLRETRNRKPLKRPAWFGATWELRFGPNNRFRVFYRVDLERREVFVLAVGEKKGNRLLIGGEEIEI
jgi:mRNA-degrading endonuclease RelE of RelBE toxin-antitoxin system